jgi:hypothetical protein
MYRANKNFGMYLTYQLKNAVFKNHSADEMSMLPASKYSKIQSIIPFNGSLNQDSEKLANMILD